MSVPQHPHAGQQQDVRHACPECEIGKPQPFCRVCLGVGNITTERLAWTQRMYDRYPDLTPREWPA